MKRTLSLLTLVALLALPACSSTPGAAATVDGHEISSEQLLNDIKDFGKSQTFSSQFAEQAQAELIAKGASRKSAARTAAMSFTSQWLGSLVQNEAIAQMAKQRGVSVNARQLAQTEAQLTQQAGATWQELPERLRTRIVKAQALQDALRAKLPATESNQILDQAYAQLQADCPTGLLVGHILVAGEAEANAVIARLDQGEAFGDVSSEVSTDQGAAAQGGLLMCVDSAQWAQLDATFTAAAEQLAADEVSPPVQTQFGVHVIKAFPLTPQNALPLLQATAQPPDPLAGAVRRYLARHEVWVNSRFGHVRRRGGFTIVPPAPAENIRSLPTTTTTTTPVPVAPGATGAGATGSGSTGTGAANP